MSILAHYLPLDIDVVVSAVVKAGGRTRVHIRAIEGEPFTVFTHGGPMTTNRAVVSPDLLCELREVDVVEPVGKISADWSDEEQERYGALFPTQFRYNPERAISPNRGGINND